VSAERDDAGQALQVHGRYANYFRVGHNAFEFVIDFGQLYAGAGEPQMHTRIVTGPGYAKALLRTLKRSVTEYERANGVISETKGNEDGK
jgi:hypothetical protein